MRTLIILSLFATLSAQACPNLEGLYRICLSSKNERTKLRIMQKIQNDITVYTIAWDGERHQIHKADGVTRETPIFDTGISLLSQAFCEGDFLKRHLSTKEASGEISESITQTYVREGNNLRFEARDRDGVYREFTCRK